MAWFVGAATRMRAQFDAMMMAFSRAISEGKMVSAHGGMPGYHAGSKRRQPTRAALRKARRAGRMRAYRQKIRSTGQRRRRQIRKRAHQRERKMRLLADRA